MSRHDCLDDPTRPSKAFRAVIVKRKKSDRAAIAEKLTPELAEAFVEYKAEGTTAKKLGVTTEDEMRKQLGESLNQALEGCLDFDVGVHCASCAFTRSERERVRKLLEEGTVRLLRSRAHETSHTLAHAPPPRRTLRRRAARSGRACGALPRASRWSRKGLRAAPTTYSARASSTRTRRRCACTRSGARRSSA